MKDPYYIEDIGPALGFELCLWSMKGRKSFNLVILQKESKSRPCKGLRLWLNGLKDHRYPMAIFLSNSTNLVSKAFIWSVNLLSRLDIFVSRMLNLLSRFSLFIRYSYLTPKLAIVAADLNPNSIAYLFIFMLFLLI